jgi:hypothetical protein
MRKGQRNIKILEPEDFEKAYQKIFNLVLNGELDNNKARVLLAILNGRVQAYKITQLEDEMDNLSALLEEYNENNR